MSASVTLLACRAVDLLVSQIVVETLTAPYRHVLLLLECLLYRATPPRDFDLEPLEQALVGPVHIAPTPIAFLRPLALWAAPPLVVGAIALPTETGVRSVVELRHLKGSSRSESKRGV